MGEGRDIDPKSEVPDPNSVSPPQPNLLHGDSPIGAAAYLTAGAAGEAEGAEGFEPDQPTASDPEPGTQVKPEPVDSSETAAECPIRQSATRD